jgi:cephalosporin hydroxylase
MSDLKKFAEERKLNIHELSENVELRKKAVDSLIKDAGKNNYSYNFDWLGLPIIQLPQDMVAIQEVIWKTKPDIIIETGVARGGSLMLSASILQLINGNGKVIGIDIDLREHNKKAILSHPLSHRIQLIEGSSTDSSTIDAVKKLIEPDQKVMIILDSNHTHEHVFNELNLYQDLVSAGCYLIVMDTVIDEMPDNYFPQKPWGKANNPKTAVHEFLKTSKRFAIDKEIQNKLVISVAPDGYLKCLN